MIKLDGVPVTPTMFPDKTSQVWKLEKCIFYYPRIEWIFEHEGEFIHLAQLMDLLRRHANVSNETTYGHLILPYLPYARQDKDVHNQSTFALRTFAKLLNSLSFASVKITDPHSEVAKIIDRVEFLYPVFKIARCFGVCDAEVIAFPDKGAINKYRPLLQGLSEIDVYGEKIRNQESGQISSYSLDDADLVKGRRVLIVDDICDGGATFVLLAKELFSNGATEVHLYVSHGIFSKGIQVLKDAGISRIFTKEGEIK